MKIDSLGRILGSCLIVTAYFTVLHISATIGALMHLIANVISLPFFTIRVNIYMIYFNIFPTKFHLKLYIR